MMRPGHKGDIAAKKMLGNMVDIQVRLSDYSREAFWPEHVVDEVETFVDSFLSCYTVLANAADRRAELLFSVTPKFHWLWHWSRRSRMLNPRKGNTMVDEDFVGVCKRIVQACANGTESHRVPMAFCEKYRVGQWFLNTFGDEYSTTA